MGACLSTTDPHFTGHNDTTHLRNILSSFLSQYCELSPTNFADYKLLRLAFIQKLHTCGVRVPYHNFNQIFITLLSNHGLVTYGDPTVVVGLKLTSWVTKQPQ
jgi:hypothetical protein